MIDTRSIFCLFALLAACSPHDASQPAHKSLSQRLDQKNSYKQDAKGNWLPQNDQRSSFESKGKSPYFQGTYQKKTYQTDTYSKKSWWGSKDYSHKNYEGNTDGKHFQKPSRFSDQNAREANTAANIPSTYQTGAFATHSAREARTGHVAKPTDTLTEMRRKSYPAPEIIDWKQQRSMSMDQSKSILGR